MGSGAERGGKGGGEREGVEEEERDLGESRRLPRWALLTKDGPGCGMIGCLSRSLLSFNVEPYSSHLPEAANLQLLLNFHAQNMRPSKAQAVQP